MENNKSMKQNLEKPKVFYFKPFIKDSIDTSNIMLDVVIALIPSILGSIYFFGLRALLIILISVGSCVGFEFLTQKILNKPIRIGDLSAVVTGILLAMNLSVSVPLWIPIFGAFFAIVIIKESFGGIGSNFINPALGARAILMASWPDHMAAYVGGDAITGATPLTVLDTGVGVLPTIGNMLVGNIGGVLGETSAILLLIGGIYLIAKNVINWRIPITYIISLSIALFIFGVELKYIPYHILGGATFLGAFFMATDYATTPYTNKGKIIFSLGAGFITAVIKVFGSLPEGFSYSILIMNAFTPLIDKYTANRVYGEVK